LPIWEVAVSIMREGGMSRLVVFIIWFAITAVVGVRLTALHLIPLPQPGHAAAIEAAIPVSSIMGAWSLTHILAVDCPCSQRIADHLLGRGVVPGASEEVWILGSNPGLAGKLKVRGFQVSAVDPDHLAASTGIEGGPWLLIRNPAGKLAYSGGYSSMPMNVPAEARDLELLDRCRKGEYPPAWPAFGCAASHALQRKLDPLGLHF
jgi:hypothetical protein